MDSFFKDFIYLRERENKHVGVRKREKQSPPTESEHSTGSSVLGPWDHDLSCKQMLNRLSHPSVPTMTHFY